MLYAARGATYCIQVSIQVQHMSCVQLALVNPAKFPHLLSFARRETRNHAKSISGRRFGHAIENGIAASQFRESSRQECGVAHMYIAPCTGIDVQPSFENHTAVLLHTDQTPECFKIHDLSAVSTVSMFYRNTDLCLHAHNA